jgi:hypothetical protein
VLQNCWHVLKSESAACNETFAAYHDDGNEEVYTKVEEVIDIKEETFPEAEKFPLIKNELQVRCVYAVCVCVCVRACSCVAYLA